MNRRIVFLGGSALAAAIVIVAFLIRSREAPVPLPTKTGERASVTREISERHWVVSRKAHDEYLVDGERLNREIHLKPTLSGPDRVTELVIEHLAPSSPIHKTGLRQGDRILSVNGSTVSTLGRAVNLVHEIKACSRLTVQIRRDDKIIDYQFDFE